MIPETDLPELSVQESEIYSWQTTVEGFGEEGQRRLKNASVLISRIGGLGGLVAFELAAAGVGRLILAHAGNIRLDDLNRQLLMTHAALGTSRVACARQRLLDLNPRLDVLAVPENMSSTNVARLVAQADVVVDCAPLFAERFALNSECVRQGKPLVECAMFETEIHLSTFQPGRTGCLACLYPEAPPDWQRRFPVFGAVSGTVGCLGAMEVIKLIANFGQPLFNRLLTIDLRNMASRTVRLRPNPSCSICRKGVQTTR